MSESCVIHYEGVADSETTKAFTDITATRVWEFGTNWSEVPGEGHEVSVRLQIWFNGGNSLCNGQYHLSCYQKFTNRRLLSQARKGKLVSPSSEEQHVNKRLLTRSTHERDLSTFPKGNDHVPLVCIVCQRERYIKSANGGWTRDKLVTCEGDGELLLKKVKERQDENILHHLRAVGDLASAEIHYHCSCYRNYTRGTDTAVTATETLEDVIFQEFCSDVITKRLYQNKEGLSMSRLHQMYLFLGEKSR